MTQKWIAGIRRGDTWVPHPDSPWFDTGAEAEAWARGYLEEHPDAIQRGLTGLEVKRVSTSQ